MYFEYGVWKCLACGQEHQEHDVWDDLLRAILKMAKQDYLCHNKPTKTREDCQYSPYTCYKCKETAKEYVLG